ncbi:unnamed protein product [Thelazia callipaeda]|uniref:Anti_prolifrtn domain-containing protein n=1 Tax=Thelazia callipaeda TaxID=103827 RepID=A0A0N5D0L7_THECL|nr:unnamed protein product [Thelazia callipaeda]
MYREIEEAVAFIAGYFYYKLPRSRVDLFAVRLANIILKNCRKIISEDRHKKLKKNSKEEEHNIDILTREVIIEINCNGKLAVAIVEATSVFDSALLPNAVKLHISEGMVKYSFRSNLICLYRSDGNMHHIHRKAYHTHLRPPLTTVADNDNRKFFQDTFPRRQHHHRKKYCISTNDNKQLRRMIKSAHYWYKNQQLPGPTRSAKLSGNGFMHPTLPPSYNRKWNWNYNQMCRRFQNENKISFGKNVFEKRNYSTISTSNRIQNPKSQNFSFKNPSGGDYVTRKKNHDKNTLINDQNFSSKNHNGGDYVTRKKNYDRNTIISDDVLRSFGVIASYHTVNP